MEGQIQLQNNLNQEDSNKNLVVFLRLMNNHMNNNNNDLYII